eukprot:CAMPEP_0185853012 /NCGR_PEP_ID=MMETSP1354-20130828/17141_1 /TAXON_ID=708628 /ORGANISM="Erythrolobus madagascarensis, Strain CCMP3276" /LENGTH=62 /DNA_ID=CAMNT_0028554401 /DNA_START=22 /DNA_END=206 /DNA_ORIENTATION=-
MREGRRAMSDARDEFDGQKWASHYLETCDGSSRSYRTLGYNVSAREGRIHVGSVSNDKVAVR